MVKKHKKRTNTKMAKKVNKPILKMAKSFCTSYTLLSGVVYILKLISKLGNNIFFQWCGIISDILNLPMSQSDLLIMFFGLHSVIVIFGICFLIKKIYKFLSNYNHF